MTPERRVDRAARAQALLSDDLLVGTLQAMRAAYVAAWLATESRDPQGREFAWMCMKAVDDFERRLKRIADDGKMAQADIDARERNAG